MFKKGLIAFLTFCVASSFELSAQNVHSLMKTGLLASSDQPGSAAAETMDSPIMDDEPADAQISKYDLLVPEPFKDFQINMLAEKDPLPPYYSVEGIYKIDCVYIDGFDYFKLWETNKLNPYGFNGEQYNDTLKIELFDNKGLGSWYSPLDHTVVTSDFGLRRAVWHYGVDIRVRTGQPVYAVFDGVVRITGYDRWGFGRFVLLRHKNGLETLYGHLSKNFVKLGQEVEAGEVIGQGGNSGRSTAAHLHFEIRYSGNAINPNELFDFKENAIISSKYIVNPASFSYLEEANKIRYHVIRSGDTLSGLSYRYSVSINRMCSLNGISRNSILRIGQRVRIN